MLDKVSFIAKLSAKPDNPRLATNALILIPIEPKAVKIPKVQIAPLLKFPNKLKIILEPELRCLVACKIIDFEAAASAKVISRITAIVASLGKKPTMEMKNCLTHIFDRSVKMRHLLLYLNVLLTQLMKSVVDINSITLPDFVFSSRVKPLQAWRNQCSAPGLAPPPSHSRITSGSFI